MIGNETVTFTKLYSAKRDWQVIPIKNASCIPGAELTVQRALVARKLELPVGAWILEASRREKDNIGEEGLRLFNSNIKDEFKHDEQLTAAFNNLNLVDEKTKATIEAEGDTLLQSWLAMGNKYHPVLITWILEQSIFFPVLAMYRRLGGVQMALVSTEISRDETIHTRTNGTLTKMLELDVTPELDDLRQQTMEWLTQDLDGSVPGKYGKSRTYLDASVSLIRDGFYAGFSDTKAAVVPAFFEVANSNLPKYGSK